MVPNREAALYDSAGIEVMGVFPPRGANPMGGHAVGHPWVWWPWLGGPPGWRPDLWSPVYTRRDEMWSGRPAIERTVILWEPDVWGAAGARIGVRRWDAGRP